MNQDELVKEIVEANATEVYKDAAQPSIRILGNTLAQCVSLFARPIGRVAQILEKNINTYLDKLERIPPGEIIEPDTRILVPVLEKLRYIDDQKVADYYAEILASASTKQGKSRVSLSFIEILNRISADELRILEYVTSDMNILDITYFTEEERKKYGIGVEVKHVILTDTIPVVNVNIINENSQKGFRILKKNFNILDQYLTLDQPESMAMYLDNLLSLGLLSKTYGERLILAPIYKLLKEDKSIKGINIEEGHSLNFHEGKLDITDLCRRLLEVGHKYEK